MDNRSAPRISNEDLRRWIDRVGDATIPLFAGFSFATLIVVCQDSSKFRWPALTIFVLTIASVSLIGSVQGRHQARMYLPTFEDFQMQRESKGPPVNWENENSYEYKRARFSGQSTRLTYHAGIVSLLAGLALALAPPGGTALDNALRWSASAIASFACLFEFGATLRQWVPTLRQWVPQRYRDQHEQSPGHQS